MKLLGGSVVAATLSLAVIAAVSAQPLQGRVETETAGDVFSHNAGLDPLAGRPETTPTSGNRCIPLDPSWRLIQRDERACYWYAPFARPLQGYVVVPMSEVAALERNGGRCGVNPFNVDVTAVCQPPTGQAPTTGAPPANIPSDVYKTLPPSVRQALLEGRCRYDPGPTGRPHITCQPAGTDCRKGVPGGYDPSANPACRGTTAPDDRSAAAEGGPHPVGSSWACRACAPLPCFRLNAELTVCRLPDSGSGQTASASDSSPGPDDESPGADRACADALPPPQQAALRRTGIEFFDTLAAAGSQADRLLTTMGQTIAVGVAQLRDPGAFTQRQFESVFELLSWMGSVDNRAFNDALWNWLVATLKEARRDPAGTLGTKSAQAVLLRGVSVLPAACKSAAGAAVAARHAARIERAKQRVHDLERRLDAESIPVDAESVCPSLTAVVDKEIQLSSEDYFKALRLVFPSMYADEVMPVVEAIGHGAAVRAVANPKFVDALRARNWALAGTYFHSAAAQEARALPASALPSGWRLFAEETIQSGKGGSRSDLVLRGPNDQLYEIDWKTTGASAVSKKNQCELKTHAWQITTSKNPNIQGGTLVVQQSRSWVDYVRPLLARAPWSNRR